MSVVDLNSPQGDCLIFREIMITKKLCITCLSLLLVLMGRVGLAQSERALADGFGKLTLGQTTPEEAIHYLGKLDSESTDSLKASELQRWLSPKHKEKIFRKLRFRSVENFRLVELSFHENKLVMIDLVFRKEFSPANLKKVFGIGFATWSVAFGPFPSSAKKLDTQTKYENFNPNYYRIGASEKTFLNSSSKCNPTRL